MNPLQNQYFKLLRINHWFKNIFIFFGVAVALWLYKVQISEVLIAKVVGAFLLASFISSVNYVINQITDKDFDKKHPIKKLRPIPSGKVSSKVAFIFSLIIFLITMFLTVKFYNINFQTMIFIFWVAGIFYNVKPIRLKDLPYIDVLSESINNPIRFLIGWFAVIPSEFPSIEILLLTWTAGAFLMTAKRYDELFYFGKDLTPYRHTFGTYSLKSLKNLLVIYAGSSFILFTYLVYGYESRLILIIPFVFIYMVWLFRSIISGEAKARNIEEYFFTREFLSISILILIIIIGIIQIF